MQHLRHCTADAISCNLCIDITQVGRGVGGLASGVWGGLSGKSQKKEEPEAEEAEGEGEGEESAGGKGSFF